MLLLGSWTALFAQDRRNVLVVEPVAGRVGTSISIPINLENTDEVVAAQFDVTLPFSADKEGQMTLGRRVNGHSVSASGKDNQITVVVSSMENKAVKGNSGVLVRIPMVTYDDGKTNSSYSIRLSNIVLTDRWGNNIATSKTCEGTFNITHENLPDLVVKQVTVPGNTSLTPGKTATFNYTVANQGDGATAGGWTAKLYIQSSTTGLRTYIGSQYHSGTMAAGQEVNKEVKLKLPVAMHMDGKVKVVVEVIPSSNCGELIVDQANNTGRSASEYDLSKFLVISSNYETIYESFRDYTTITLMRTGDWSVSESFEIASTVKNLFYAGYESNLLPIKLVIPAGQTSASFRLYCVNDNIVRAAEDDIIAKAAHGYAEVRCHIRRIDDDRNPLSIVSSTETLEEGQKLTLTITRGGELTDEVEMALQCNYADRFTAMPNLQFKAGESRKVVELTAIDDAVNQLDRRIRFWIVKKDYQTADKYIKLLDDDRPTIQLSISPGIVGEAAGNYATTAFITRTGDLTTSERVRLTSDSKEVFTGTTLIEMPAGEKRVEVPIGIRNNTVVESSRKAKFTAALYLPYDNEYAPTGDRANSQAALTITDDESPYLTLTANTHVVGEGSSVLMTVHRTVPSYANPLTVSLSALEGGVNLPSTVTIAAGLSYEHFTVSIPKNYLEDDERQVTITAHANGVEDAAMTLTVTDRTLADAIVPSVAYEGELYAGVPATFKAEVQNVGTKTLEAGAKLSFYLCSSDSHSRYTGSYTHILTETLDRELAIGDAATFTFGGTVPNMTGKYWLLARVNEDKAIPEYTYANNESPRYQAVNIAAPFSVVSISTDKTDYVPGEYVIVKGRMEGKLYGQTVHVTLDGQGQDSYANVQIDADGNFQAAVLVDCSAHGYMKVLARAQGQTEAAKTTQVHVYNMSLWGDHILDCNVDYEKKGTLHLKNLSAKPVTGIELSQSVLPYGMELKLNGTISRLAPGETIDIPFTVVPTVVMNTLSYESFSVSATCEEGASDELDFSYLCRATTSNLCIIPSPLETTLQLGTKRIVDIDLKNYGLKETGHIEVTAPTDVKWFRSLAPNTLASLEPGHGTTLRMQLTHYPDMHSGSVYTTTVVFTPENGPSRILTIRVRIVGTEYSTLNIQANDVYSLSQSDFSHVEGAKVDICNARTGESVMSGVIGNKGIWTTDRITEGKYIVTLTGKRHQIVKQTVNIGPGETISLNEILPYKAVLANFYTSRNLEDDTYEMVSDIDVDYLAPQAIVLPELSMRGFGCGDETAYITMRNVGSRTAINPVLDFPTNIEGVSFELLNSYPSRLTPGQSYVLRVRYQGPESARRRIIGTLHMKYNFAIGANNLGENDRYEQLTCCVTREDDKPEPAPVIPHPIPDPDDPKVPIDPGAALPTPGCFFTIHYDDVTTIKTGTPVGATLEVQNGSESLMSNIRFVPTLFDYETEDDLSEMVSIEMGQPNGMTKDGNYYTLNKGTLGTLPLVFRFDEGLTADGPRKVYVGGQLTYKWKGILQTAVLPDMELTIYPSGKVELTYLIQHNYLGDNLTTTDVKEQSELAEVVVLARNRGTSQTSKLTVRSEDLSVVTDAEGMDADYSTVRVDVDGTVSSDELSAFVIPQLKKDAHSTLHWMFQAEEMAHTEAIEDLLASVAAASNTEVQLTVGEAKELIRSISSKPVTAMTVEDGSAASLDVKVDNLRHTDSYLLNLSEDEERLPDAVMEGSTLETVPLEIVTENCELTGKAGSYTLNVKAKENGWVYGRLSDPTHGQMILERVVRKSDNTAISLANFWQTDRTVEADYTVINDNLLHFADKLQGQTETYELTFASLPGQPLRVMNIEIIDKDGNVIPDGGTTSVGAKEIHIELTKPARRLFNQSLVYKIDEVGCELGNDPVSPKGDANYYTVSLSEARSAAGLHTFTVLGNTIKDKSKVLGEGEQSVSWTETIVANAKLSIVIISDEGDSKVNVKSGVYPQGEITLKAKPADGCYFVCWMIDGKVISNSAEYIYTLKEDVVIQAVFTHYMYNVSVVEPETGGSIIGSGSGTYNSGSNLLWVAVPDTGYRVKCWMLNDTEIGEGNSVLKWDVVEDATVTAVFEPSDVDAVEEIHTERPVDANTYTLTGIRIPSSMAQKGVFIVGGKKVLR